MEFVTVRLKAAEAEQYVRLLRRTVVCLTSETPPEPVVSERLADALRDLAEVLDDGVVEPERDVWQRPVVRLSR